MTCMRYFFGNVNNHCHQSNIKVIYNLLKASIVMIILGEVIYLLDPSYRNVIAIAVVIARVLCCLALLVNICCCMVLLNSLLRNLIKYQYVQQTFLSR